MKVFLSQLAEEKLLKLNEYLLENWSFKVRDQFFNKFKSKVEQISLRPESCPQSSQIKGLFKCVVSKQTTFFYRINYQKDEIEIITVFDTRQNPSSLKKEI